MIVPFDAIDEATLANLIEEFVTREGTDYGDYELTLNDKVQAVQHGLNTGELVIIYIQSTQSVNIVKKEQLENSM